MKSILTLIVTLVIWSPSYSQSALTHSDLLDERKNLVYKNHTDSYVAYILTGRYYNTKYPGAKNSQYFKAKKLDKGVLVYDGVVFDNIDMQYDLFLQKIVILLDSKNYIRHVTIDSERVSEFSIVGCDFKRINNDSVMKKGFHQIAFDGQNSSLFIKRMMNKKESIEQSKIRQEFLPVYKYYIKNRYGTFLVQKKKEILAAYDNSKETMAAIKKNRLKFSKKKREKSLIKLVSILDPKFRND